MMIFRRWAVLWFGFGLTFLGFAGTVPAGQDVYPFRFPELSNPNAVGGRLYLQPLGDRDHRVLENTEITVSFGSATDYNVHFVEKDGDRELTVNTNTYSLGLTRGFTLFGRPLETGGVFRDYQDMRKTWGSELVKHYHESFSDGFGEVPPDGQFDGAVGENETRVIGKNREFYLNTLQVYAKTQILRERPGSALPDLAVKLSGRIPLTGKPFDTPGIGLSAGLSKRLSPAFSFIGAAGWLFQDLSARDFNATNLRVRHFAFDLFSGILWDMGEAEGWYTQMGMRWASERISYRANSDSAGPSYVVHFGPAYRVRTKEGRTLEIFLSCSEDIPGLGHGLEPDVGFYTGVALGFP